ncbi:MAG: MFS transporter [Alphaproteobacteria bacterium]|jgi:UMF1 family MFS transporter|nr:MFS transporter [Alphaproteobacteria bacterium]
MAQTSGEEVAPTRTRGLVGWALYDWANSPFTTLIITFVFSAYFSRGIVGDEVRGAELWGYTASIAGLVIALGSPVLGAIADAGGPRKPWLLVFTAICVVGSGALWYAGPAPEFITWAMVWVVIATIGFEFGIVFNNAMLPDLVAPARLGRWSGWAWGLGYFGGLAAMVATLFLFVQAETPLLGLDKESAEHVRVVGPLAAVWFAVFVWPMFVFTPDRDRSGLALGEKVRRGLSNLWGTLMRLRDHGNIVRFLIARMIYADGLVTVFAFGGIYAADTFGMALEQVIIFGIVLNVTAGIGAFCFAWLDDWFGSKRVIYISLSGLLATALGAVVVQDVAWFWVWGSLLGIFVGPAQAASRSLMARLAPAELRTEFFGLYALTGKATAFAGPALVAIVIAATESQRWGLSTVLAFFAVGFLLLLTVKEPERV